MGWREFRAWLRECNRAIAEENRQSTADPESWDGYASDGWWAEQRAKQNRMRGS